MEEPCIPLWSISNQYGSHQLLSSVIMYQDSIKLITSQLSESKLSFQQCHFRKKSKPFIVYVLCVCVRVRVCVRACVCV